MTMPTFEPIARVNEYNINVLDWLDTGDSPGRGDSLYAADQLQQAYEAGKRDAAPQVEQEPVGYFYQNERGFWNQAGDPIGFPAMTKLYAAPPAPAVPDGFMLVPTTATAEMIAAAEGVEDLYRRGTPDTWAKVFRVMIAAAPACSTVASDLEPTK